MAMDAQELLRLKTTARDLRLTVIDVMKWSGGAHVGGSLSCMDLLTALYFRFLKLDPERPDWPERDRFILSKGHAAAGYIPVLAKRGFFPEDTLRTFNHFGSPFAMHPDSNKVVGCDASTGSLGHGLPMAFGMGLGFRYQKMDNKVVCLMGDGECQEGSVWEAAMAIAHYGLTNVITIVDRNHCQIDGDTESVMALEPFADKWRAFGLDVLAIDGNDMQQVCDALETAWSRGEGDKPVLILADTVKGKGVDFMENQVPYHYCSGTAEVCEKAKASILKMEV